MEVVLISIVTTFYWWNLCSVFNLWHLGPLQCVSSLTVSQQIRLGESVVYYCVILSMMSYAAPGDVMWSANKGQNVTNKGSIYPFMCSHHQLSSHRHEKNNSKCLILGKIPIKLWELPSQTRAIFQGGPGGCVKWARGPHAEPHVGQPWCRR